ncbi:MAG: cysteine--tRNA ligase [Candidatus Marinimicrobia bacterium]|nr:cysteine--tRNA ligase [Candidatus Neomarinimicrobiota bacterium]|tara:strand:+ start:966 stop:2360 length:1395 start_codon:yes stop_codon:yes gene_type:complete
MFKLKIYNTITNQKEDFEPIDLNHIRMYTCGPTVYNYAHIGNARPAIISDILVRVLRFLYPKVTYASNITDIDDKIIESSQELGISIEVLTEKYERIYNEDMQSIGVLPPDKQPHATDHIDEMIDLIQKNIDNDKAYVSNGHVLFDVTSYQAYGKLSGRDVKDQIAGSRVEVADYKRNPGDFVLWKPSSGDQPGWESPWGFGRPGWHLECSAMSESNLGLPFDIHGGGMDLIFPHHENEIAQSCGSINENSDPRVYSKYWIHNALLNMDGEKMSKSLGNILYIRKFLEQYDGEVLRLALLSSHYRQPLNWTEDTIEMAKNNLDRFYRVLKNFNEVEIIDMNDELLPEDFLNALCDDLNISVAIAELNKMIKALNNSSNNKDQIINKTKLLFSANILGILQKNPLEWFKVDDSNLEINKIDDLVKSRDEARKNKNFELADKIRNQLSTMGIEIEDSPEGTSWRKK